MEHKQLDINFLQQFRKGVRVYSSSSPKELGNILYRSFSGNKKESMFLGNLLSGRLSHGKIIRKLLDKLDTSDCQVSMQLASKVRKLRRKFISYARSEPSTAEYYSRKLRLLKLLSKLVEVFREKVLKTLLNSLGEISSGKMANVQDDPITSADVEDLQILFVEYFRELDKYYCEFKSILEAEETRPGAVKVATIVEQCLSNLLEDISTNINELESTERLLNKWRLKLEFVEMEECYN